MFRMKVSKEDVVMLIMLSHTAEAWKDLKSAVLGGGASSGGDAWKGGWSWESVGAGAGKWRRGEGEAVCFSQTR